MSELLVVPAVGTTPTLAISNEAKQTKDGLLTKAKPILAITNEAGRDVAIRVAGNIKTHLKALESSRIEVKKPFLDISRNIDITAGTHKADLELELYRINRLVGQFELDRKEAARQAEEDLRKEQERLAALVAPVEKFPAATTEGSGEALAAQLDAEERLGAATEKLEKAQVAAEAAKPTGGALRKDWDIEVLDIKALYAAHPQCVELTARNMAIKDLLKTGITPTGVRATPKVAYSARATTARIGDRQ